LRSAFNPLEPLPIANVEQDRGYVRRPLTPEEQTRLLLVADAKGHGLAWRHNLLQGARRGEIASMLRSHLDLHRSVITLSGYVF